MKRKKKTKKKKRKRKKRTGATNPRPLLQRFNTYTETHRRKQDHVSQLDNEAGGAGGGGGGGQGSKRADSVILTACLCIYADVWGARTRTRNRGPRWLDADTTHLHNQRGLQWRNGLKKKQKTNRDFSLLTRIFLPSVRWPAWKNTNRSGKENYVLRSDWIGCIFCWVL